jgi:hypothetical protein
VLYAAGQGYYNNNIEKVLAGWKAHKEARFHSKCPMQDFDKN